MVHAPVAAAEEEADAEADGEDADAVEDGDCEAAGDDAEADGLAFVPDVEPHAHREPAITAALNAITAHARAGE